MSTTGELTPSRVVDELKLHPFITKNRDEIADRLVSVYYRALQQGEEAQLLFIAECVPLLEAIVQLGSDSQKYDQLVKLIHSTPIRSQPMCILGALVFIYLVETEFADYDKNHKEHGEAWIRIRRWVARLHQVQTFGPVLVEATDNPDTGSSKTDLE